MLASYLMILHSTLFVLLFTVLFPISHVFLRYFHLSTFFWMFLEGKYLIFVLLVHFTKLINRFLLQACICSSRSRCLLHWQTSSTSTVFLLAGVGTWSTDTVLIFQKIIKIVRISSGYSDNLVHSQISSEPKQHSREHGRH